MVHESSGNMFGDLPHEQQAHIHQLIGAARPYPTGYIFHAPTKQKGNLFILHTGRVRLYKISSEYRILTLAFLEPVSIFGEMALTGPSMHDLFAEAVTPCRVVTIERDTLYTLLQTYPRVALRIMEVMGQRLVQMEDKLADIAFKSVPQRLATLLLQLAAKPKPSQPSSYAPSPLVVVGYTHQQLAEMIGCYRETVTKVLGEFREHGFIHAQGDSIYITNADALQQV